MAWRSTKGFQSCSTLYDNDDDYLNKTQLQRRGYKCYLPYVIYGPAKTSIGTRKEQTYQRKRVKGLEWSFGGKYRCYKNW
jgi:hypothetical protein